MISSQAIPSCPQCGEEIGFSQVDPNVYVCESCGYEWPRDIDVVENEDRDLKDRVVIPMGCQCNRWRPYNPLRHHALCPNREAVEEYINKAKAKAFAFQLRRLPSLTVYAGFDGKPRVKVTAQDLAATAYEHEHKRVAATLVQIAMLEDRFGPHTRMAKDLETGMGAPHLHGGDKSFLKGLLELKRSINVVLCEERQPISTARYTF